MNELSCEQVDELAPSAALGAGDDLARDVARHLRSCPNDHADTRALLASIDALPAGVLPVTPRPQLRERLMATIAGTAQGVTAPPEARRPAAVLPPQRDTEGGWLAWLRPGLARGIAAVAIPLVLVLAVVAIQLQSRLSERDATLQSVAQALSRGDAVFAVKGSAGTGYLVRGEDRATLLVAGLGDPPSGQLYEMWLITADGAAAPAGTFLPGDTDVSVVHVATDLGNAATFAVTVEQRRVDQPTSDPVLVADLTQ